MITMTNRNLEVEVFDQTPMGELVKLIGTSAMMMRVKTRKAAGRKLTSLIAISQ